MKIEDKREDNGAIEFLALARSSAFRFSNGNKVYLKTIDDITGHDRATNPQSGISSPVSGSI